MTAPDLSVDQFNLDEEFISLPLTVLTWQRRWADARLVADKAKAQLRYIEAHLDGEIRKAPAFYELDPVARLTEAVVANTIISQPDYQQAEADYHTAQHKANVAKSVVEALRDKRSSLEHLVRLYLADYYGDGTPKVPAGTTDRLQGKLTRRRAT